MRRKPKPPKDDYPTPWDDRPISLERWRRHRETMMRDQYPGSRPEEWWLYERQMPEPPYQAATLYAMGELAGAELEQVMRDWRQAYEHALGPGFSCNTGDGWLRRAAARRTHHRWAGIPRELVKQWDVERRRQAKLIRKLGRVKAATA
jgi:hypothetical protein